MHASITKTTAKFLRYKQRDRLPARDHAALNQPVTDAVKSFREGTGTAYTQSVAACALSVCYRIIEAVPRHRYLIPELQPALDALNALYARFHESPDDHVWLATDAEIAAMEFGAELYRAVLLASSGQHVRRAVAAVMRDSQ